MAIRSGRFRSMDVTGANALTLIQGKAGPFRVFNTGDNEFELIPVTGGGVTATVAPKTSIDVFVETGANPSLVVTQHPPGGSGPAKKRVSGVYEYINDFDSLRSGQFRAAGGGTALIVDGNGTQFPIRQYRIFNSGDNDISVLVDGIEITGSGVNPMPLKPTFSIDISSGEKIEVKSNGGKIEGIFDCLDTANTIRSGRFSVDDVALFPHKIIDLTQGNATPNAWYRVFNTRKGNPFDLKDNGTLIRTVATKNSFDFTVAHGRVITVEAGGRIEGIYEFLGFA